MAGWLWLSPMYRIAMISMHGCPLAKLGEKDAGGMNVYVRELSLALGQAGHSVDVFTRCQDYSTTQIVELGPGARVVHIEAGDVQFIDKRDLFPIVPQFTERVLGFQLETGLPYDVVHSHYWLSGCSATVLQREWNLPMVHMFHTLGALKNSVARNHDEREPSLRIANERRIVAQADRLIAANPAERQDLQAFYDADPSRISIIPCGVDVALFRPLPRDQARALLNLPPDAKIVLFVGRLEPIKGVDILLDALSHLNCDGCQGLALIVGGNLDGAEAARLIAIRDRLGLTSSVRFVGAQEQRTLPYFYAAADVCVVPSFYESFGMVAIEAMACGLPVIASRAGGLQFTVRDGQNGVLVPPGDSMALAAALQQVLTDAGLRFRMGAEARRMAGDYSWKRVAEDMAGVYAALKEERSGHEL
jgi:D-inositol-3-phosphate glycosyltransferase